MLKTKKRCKKQTDTGVGVLVVDDEEHLARMFQSAIADAGLRCEAVTSPKEALQCVKEGDYGILVSDILMPVLTGIDLMKKVRQLQPDMKVIFVTGVDNVDTAVEAMKLGASDFLPKPFDLVKLTNSVRRLAAEMQGGVPEPQDGAESDEEFQSPDTRHCSDLPGYKILRRIGTGAMGSVFQARQLKLDRLVAVKLIRPTAFQDESARRRFMREARAAAKMNHPNIIQVYDLIEHEGYLFLVMEYYPSKPLIGIVREVGTLPVRKAAWVALQVCRALIHASARGIVHRDVKPDNILIGKGWTAKLTDFGLAKETTLIEEVEDGVETRVGHIVGTPSYLSPEQAVSSDQIDVRSDIYGLGLCCWFMLEGRHPYTGSLPDLIMHQVNTPLPALESPDVPDEFRRIIRKMAEKEPDDRYQSGADLLRDLRALLGNLSPDSSGSTVSDG